MKMQPHELRSLHAEADAIGERDVHLGRFLKQVVTHLGHAHGLDLDQVDASQPEEERFVPDEDVSAKKKGRRE